ncbi:rhodanese-like domain-containing protein [Thiocystis violacea]|uniref:rhodanese-like domain-containing protein n=1 Tax=Thiocystis violacea TaxID=13725 RepID=UPI0019085A93|nr:rhodanese-like domain-containing protein [Thiocystis violacea]MBK1717123.1 sulfurtransferase [Thiocystis violacea]
MLYRPIRRLAVLIAASFLAIGCSQAADSGLTLTPEAALAKAQAGEITLVDIRTPGEWRQTGVAPMARRIDMRNPKDPSGFADRVLKEVGGDKSAPIALICRTGNRSGYLQQELRSLGFTNIHNVPEGMAGSKAGPGWIRRGLPVQPCPNC